MKELTWKERLDIKCKWMKMKYSACSKNPGYAYKLSIANPLFWKMVKCNDRYMLVHVNIQDAYVSANYDPIYKHYMQATEEAAVDDWFSDECPSYEEMMLFLAIAEGWNHLG